MGGSITLQEFRQRQTERKTLADRLEANWPSSAMASYFYIATAISAGQVDALKPQMDAILSTHPENLAVKYRFQMYPPAFAGVTARELLAQEPRFAEIHYLLGERAVFGAALVIAHGELTAAYETLPDSLAVVVAFGRLELAFGRYAQALQLFDRVLVRGPDEPAALGRAVALSYLKRHREALAVLDDLLKDVSSNPGDKYYWRAWNRLQLAESQPAYDDAKAAMNSMANSDVFKMAGIASYNLAKIAEARSDFESSLKMNSAECDASRYLGLIDSAERSWQPAAARFTAAAACYRQAIDALESELAKKQADTSGLYAGQIAGIAADIGEAKALLEASSRNAEVATRNATSK
jgi:tetratricopeptide (TPR) repeat protein